KYLLLRPSSHLKNCDCFSSLCRLTGGRPLCSGGHLISCRPLLDEGFDYLMGLIFISQYKGWICFLMKQRINQRISNSWLSTGWFTMTIALELCDRINVYGMVAPDFCREPQHQSVPYHYYEPRGPDECAMYISHERGRRGSHHRFITEKRVFANWARTFDIHFYQPEWSPAPLPANRTLEAVEPAEPQKT
uniref:Alpha-N-acetylgalactosaminide alpha-2,6-sialyltransferase 5 n=1 Tax=Oryzias sinensis TaxID=183150 RepID=A0A8C7ZLH8_9TELE